MMNGNPLISIVCVSMNHEMYIEQAMRSFIEQRYKNIEILYLDNASADKTFDIATGLLSESNRPFQAFKRERSYNLPQNFNFLIEKAKGKYLCFISCDDWMKKEFIAQMVMEYEQHPAIGLLYSNGWYYYEDKKKYELAENKKFIWGRIFDHIFLNGVLFPPGVIIKKEIFDVIGLYDESIPIEDYDMWLRIASVYEIGYSPNPAIYYRKHFKSMTLSSTCKHVKYYIQITDKYQQHKLYRKVNRNYRKLTIYCCYIHEKNIRALKMIITDFHFEIFYFSVIFKLILSMFGYSDSQKKRFDK